MGTPSGGCSPALTTDAGNRFRGRSTSIATRRITQMEMRRARGVALILSDRTCLRDT